MAPPPPVLPPGCRQDAVPVDQPCITDDVGVFVSGGSGSGGGGSSIAIARHGDAPVLIGTSLAIGKPGPGVGPIAPPDVRRLAIAESKQGIAVTMQSV